MTSTVTAVTFDRCWHVSRVLSQWLQYTIKFYSCQDLSNRILSFFRQGTAYGAHIVLPKPQASRIPAFSCRRYRWDSNVSPRKTLD